MPTGLYGIEHSNRDSNDHWGKNCFNSSFPAAMASYMMEHDFPAIYIKLEDVDGELKTVSAEISIRDVFNCGVKSASELSSILKLFLNHTNNILLMQLMVLTWLLKI